MKFDIADLITKDRCVFAIANNFFFVFVYCSYFCFLRILVNFCNINSTCINCRNAFHCILCRVRERSVSFDMSEDCQDTTDCVTEDERFEWGSCNTVCHNNGIITGNLAAPCSCANGYHGLCCTERKFVFLIDLTRYENKNSSDMKTKAHQI